MGRRPADPEHGCAWVTGASSGIGAALVRRLVAEGWKVAATARDRAALEELAAESPEAIFAAPADVADEAAMSACARAVEARFGPIGLVVANAGVYLPVHAPAIDPGLYRRTFEVNVLGVAHLLAPVLPAMAARRKGHVHIVSSATGFGGMPTASAYGASKAALINMAECLKIELERHGVGVSLSTPGFVDTPAQTDNAFPKPFMVSAAFAARRIADGLKRGGFETSFPRRFTWLLKALYALPKPIYLPLVRKQTGWAKPL
ncbi:MAG: SDR family NAD(P)-dependent oxidoreductase [Alphaproteobacteria bacterium]|nr:SDR family NAD(P)-dependent oxidoreductase [Alphaproteobacteria bacterium]